MYSFLEGKYKYYRIYINDNIITGNENDQLLGQRNEDLQSKRTTKFITKGIYSENSLSKISSVKTKKIKKRIRIEELNAKNSNNINIEKKSDNIFKSEFISNSNNIEVIFNKIKCNIINKKETFPIKIMYYLCLIFAFTTIIFLFIHEKIIENSFQNLSTFLDENIFFNMTKMGVAVLYITSINIKWQLHNCSLNTFYNLTLLNEEKLIENIIYIQWLKDYINNFRREFEEVINKEYGIKPY